MDVNLIELIAANGISQGRAKAAYGTYRAIKDSGLDEVKAGMSEATFYRHKKYLKEAGITDADLMAGNVIAFRPVRIVLALAGMITGAAALYLVAQIWYYRRAS